MEAESIKLQDRNYGLYIALFIIIVFVLQCFIGLYTYSVVRPEIIQSVDSNLEKFKQNILSIIERDANNNFDEDYDLFNRKKREVEGSGDDYGDTDEESSELIDEYELKNVEEFCKQVNTNCVKVGPPGLSGPPGLKGEKGDRGLPGLQGPPGVPATVTTTAYPVTEPAITEETFTENVTVVESSTSQPSGCTSITKPVLLSILCIIMLVIN